jgi:xanthine dehydrogenase small subunit
MATPGGDVRFVLNGQTVTAQGIAPTTTLLEYLRLNCHLPGTKEGCAEGDCGACTVSIGEVSDGVLTYRAVNACIQFMPMVEGKSVTTIEALAQPDGTLHPIQQAMVDYHGAQCGFCTPGIIMSLYAAYMNAALAQSLPDVLAGNLCRCTGYGPIIAAAKTAFANRDSDAVAARRAVDLALIDAPSRGGVLALIADGCSFFSPDSLDDALELADVHPDAVILGGATDVGLWVTKQRRQLDKIIWLGRIDALRMIDHDGDRLIIGAGVTFDQLAQSPLMPAELKSLIRRIGGVQVRQTGTIGGNIANGSPIGDLPPALTALGATLVLASRTGERMLALEDYFISYGVQDRRAGEIVRAIIVPLGADDRALGFYKLSKRFDSDISTLCGCFNISIEAGIVRAARIAFGGMAATPKRALEVERRLTGAPWTENTLRHAQDGVEIDFTPISDLRGSATYRLNVARNLLRRFYLEQSGDLAKSARLDQGAAP